MKVWWIIILALGLVGSATFIPFVKITAGTTTVTGTTLTTEAWLGMRPVSRKRSSPLADWCQAHGVIVTEDAVVFSKITQNVWGIIWSRESGSRPAICDFTFAMQKDWLARTPEKQIGRFIEAMVSTDEVGRSRLIEATVVPPVK